MTRLLSATHFISTFHQWRSQKFRGRGSARRGGGVWEGVSPPQEIFRAFQGLEVHF
jgi:hypothetical protein